MIPDVSYIHVVIPIDWTKYEDMFNKAVELFKHDATTARQQTTFRNEEYYHPGSIGRHDLFLDTSNKFSDSGIALGQELLRIRTQFHNLMRTLPTTSSTLRNSAQAPSGPAHFLRTFQNYNTSTTIHRRHKRFWGGIIAALLGAGVMGTFMGIFNTHQVQSMASGKHMDLLVQDNLAKNEIIELLNSRIGRALEASRTVAGDYHFITRYLIWLSIVRHLDHRLMELSALIGDLHKHRLSPLWFSEDNMRTLHQNVHSFASANQVLPLTEYTSDYFQTDVSFVSSQGQLAILLHVPATKHREKWNIFRHHPFPIPATPGHITLVSSQHPIIAVGGNLRYKVMDDAGLHNCLRRNHYYLCTSPVITHTTYSSSCVGALMGQDSAAISDLCSIRIEPDREMVMQASERSFAIYSPEVLTAQGQCMNGTIITRQIGRSSIIDLEPGCNLRLKHHLIEVPLSFTTPRLAIIATTGWDTLEIPKQLLRADDLRQLQLYKLLLNDSQDDTLVKDGLRMSQAQLAMLHHQLTAQVDDSTRVGIYIIAGLSAFVGAFFILWLLICCTRYWTRQLDINDEDEDDVPQHSSPFPFYSPGL